MVDRSPQDHNLAAYYRGRVRIDIEYLRPRTLHLLLNVRGREPPSDFAGADHDAMRLGLVSKNLMPVFLNQYTMILHGAYDDTEYGKIIS